MSNNESNEPNSNLEKSNSNANQIMKLAQNNLNDVMLDFIHNCRLRT